MVGQVIVWRVTANIRVMPTIRVMASTRVMPTIRVMASTRVMPTIRVMTSTRVMHTIRVMPGLGPVTHDFAALAAKSRGSPACAGMIRVQFQLHRGLS